MSVFVRVDKFGSESRVLRLRGLVNDIGEDAVGVITSESVKVPYFSVLAVGERYLLKLHTTVSGQSGKSFGKIVPAASQTWLNGEAYFGIGDYTFFITAASNDAEALAQSDLKSEEIFNAESTANLPKLSYKVAGLGKAFTLFKGIELSLGSHEDCAIRLELEGIAPLHLALTYSPPELICRAIHRVSLNERVYEGGSFTLSEDGTIKLLPLGIQINIHFPGT